MKTHVQVIIETRGPGNEQRSANANKVDVGLEVGLQSCFAEAQRLLELQLVRKDGGVSAVLQNVLGGESAKGISAVKRGGHLYWNVFKRSVNGRGEKSYRCKKSDIGYKSRTHNRAVARWVQLHSIIPSLRNVESSSNLGHRNVTEADQTCIHY